MVFDKEKSIRLIYGKYIKIIIEIYMKAINL